jgi:chemotaxis protein methyltransferase CheR
MTGVSDQQFAFFEDLLRREAGLMLTPEKTYLLESRLLPVAQACGAADAAGLVARLREEGGGPLRRLVVEAMMTSETSFFRDTTPFARLKNDVLPRLIAARRAAGQRGLRLWSAACASGQEPYSLAMLVREYGTPLDAWPVEILATDLSRHILAQAERGVYSQFDVQRGLPVQMLVKYFTQEGDQWQVREEIRKMVSFQPQNMLDRPYGLGVFDVIFCRNVLIYFDVDVKRNVLSALAQALKPDGFLFLGGAETVLGLSDVFEPLDDIPGTYGHKR